MTHDYIIEGMTCQSCLAKVKNRLLSTAGVESADLRLQKPQAIIVMNRHIPTAELQESISKAGHYTIQPNEPEPKTAGISWFNTYKPVLLIFFYLVTITVLIQVTHASFTLLAWMQHFMAGFFLVFSFFKMLDIKSFADSYAMYDVVASRWKAWGYIYPFAELALGLAYLLAPAAAITNIMAFSIMLVSITGVLRSLLQKRTIRCVCLGAVFNLPMSTITLIEDGLMIVMSAVMLFAMV